MVYPSKYGGFSPFPIFLIPIIYILIVLIFGAVSDWLLVILIIVTAIIGYMGHNISVREREKPRIKKLIYEYKEARRKLYEHINHFCIFEFPESLNYRYNLHFDEELYKKLSRMKQFTYSKIKRYNVFGEILNEKIRMLTSKGKKQNLIKNPKAEDGGKKWILTKKGLSKKDDLSEDIDKIKTMVEELMVEAKILVKKLEKIIPKLEKEYFTEDNTQLGEKILY